MLSWHFLPTIGVGGVTIMSMELLQQPHSEVEKIDRLNDRWELVRGCLQTQKDASTRKGNQFLAL